MYRSEDHSPRYRLVLQQQHMLFKSPSFSNHGGEVAMRLMQYCFQTTKPAIKTCSPNLYRVNVKAWLAPVSHRTPSTLLFPSFTAHPENKANNRFLANNMRVTRHYLSKKKKKKSTIFTHLCRLTVYSHRLDAICKTEKKKQRAHKLVTAMAYNPKNTAMCYYCGLLRVWES